MCQGHPCVACGSRYIYRHGRDFVCHNISNTIQLQEGCSGRRIASCPSCGLDTWRINLPLFQWASANSDWQDVSPNLHCQCYCQECSRY